MGHDTHGFWGRFGISQSLKRWGRALQNPAALSMRDLTEINGRLRGLRDRVDQLAAQARSELRNRSNGPDGIDRPDQCDWATRPGPWVAEQRPRGRVDLPSPTDLGGGVKVFHDATHCDLSLRQDPTPAHVEGAKFGLVIEVYRFNGSFLSLVQDLPPEAVQGLTLNHFVAVHLRMDREQPLEVYARLNVQHGPNTDQIVRQFAFDGDRGVAEFDLAYTKINEKRLEKAWLDLILEGPQMNRVALWDMVILRAPRADI
jgi:hypothetical protein